MKKKFTFNDFKKQELTEKATLQIKGGRTRIRRPSNTTTTAIWDDVDVRKDQTVIFGGPDLTIKFSRRGG